MAFHEQVTGHASCGSCAIRHRAVCALCDAKELAQLEAIKHYTVYEPGQPILWAGERMDFVASVVTGIATLSKTMEDGRRQMVGLLLPSDFIGRPGRDAAPYCVNATTEVVLCCFRRLAFEALMQRTPHLVNRLLDMTLDELDAARDWMLVLGRKTAREKIASLISVVAQRDTLLRRQPRGPVTLDLPLTREAMADFLGLTLETVSRQISALRRDGVIRLEGNRHVVIPDLARLLVEAGEDTV